MKGSLIIAMSLIFFFGTYLTYSGVKNEAIYKQEYKRALDAGTDAATKFITYNNELELENLSYGFGSGELNTNNIHIDRDSSLEWFYKLFFRNLDLQDNELAKATLKEYIPMKALITYNNISIADNNDNWILDKDFIIDYNNNQYLFTLSNQIFDINNNTWILDSDIGLNTEERQELVTNFIITSMEEFINSRSNMNSGNYYKFNIGLNYADERIRTIEGSSLIVLSEGLPMPSLNWFSPKEKFYAFSIGGSEVSRK